jgi:putative ABC transport system substrate-binding protein
LHSAWLLPILRTNGAERPHRVTTRRAFLGALAGGVLTPRLAAAQPAEKVARVGYLSAALTASPHLSEAFRHGLRDLGYVEGRNLKIEYRDAKGKIERLPALAAELAALKPDVIFAAGASAGARAAKQATTTIPVVFGPLGDPIAEGLVGNLARPGGNVTGVSVAFDNTLGQCLERLKQAVPRVRRVAMVHKPGSQSAPAEEALLKEIQTAAQTLGIQLQVVLSGSSSDLDQIFASVIAGRAEALIFSSTPVFFAQRRRFMELALKHRLATITNTRDFVEAGGLMSYGANIADLFRRAGGYVARILQGARPGDLPVEQPTKFELVINQRTAKTLGLTIPPLVLQRADDVIQ